MDAAHERRLAELTAAILESYVRHDAASRWTGRFRSLGGGSLGAVQVGMLRALYDFLYWADADG